MKTLEDIIEGEIRGRTVMLVGNAPFSEDRSRTIDAHDCVIRFNLFMASGTAFQLGLVGRKVGIWAVNLGTERRLRQRRKKQTRLLHCATLRRDYPGTSTVTPCGASEHRSLMRSARRYYSEQGIDLVTAQLGIKSEWGKDPSTGYYMAARLTTAGVAINLIGFTGKVNESHHDGRSEMASLRANRLITIHETP